jgi:zinc transporter 5/7
MASAYSLPTAAIPTHHHHSSSEHIHHHSQGLSQSPPSLSSFTPSIPAKGDENRPLGPSLGSSRRQSLGHRHNHTRDGSHSSQRANSNQPLASRPNLPTIPSSATIPSGDGHWRTGSTAGGKPLITPTHGSFDAAAMYEPPGAQSHTHHDHDHDHGHDHAHEHGHHSHDQTAVRSKFTTLLLPYTSRYPLLHAIMTDKDSRRIFYFMSYVPPLHHHRHI